MIGDGDKFDDSDDGGDDYCYGGGIAADDGDDDDGDNAEYNAVHGLMGSGGRLFRCSTQDKTRQDNTKQYEARCTK